MRLKSALVLTLALTSTILAAPPAAAGVWDAKQIPGKNASFYWAVIVGINDYASPTKDNVGSQQDAGSLRTYLLSLGWMPDHIYMLSDKSATRSGIVTAIRWLASKTNGHSAAVFHYAGHEKPFKTSADGDNEAMDVSLWATDNKYLLDGDLGKELSKVKAKRMWLHFSVCRAGGFSDWGTTGANRVVTYSSTQGELSYEDGALHRSIFGYHMIVRGMQAKGADYNKDGKVTVEEAFWWSRLPTTSHANNKQHPQINDKLSGDFILKP